MGREVLDSIWMELVSLLVRNQHLYTMISGFLHSAVL